MKFKVIYTTFFTLLAGTLLFLFSAYSSGPATAADNGYTGANGDAGFTCGTCHNDGSFGAVQITFTSGGNTPTYSLTSPTQIDVTVTGASGAPSGYGFQLIALNANDVPLAVMYSNLSTNVKETTTTGGRKYLEHNGTSATNVFSFSFQPMSLNGTVPEIKFHVAAVAVNAANGNANDSGSNGFTFTLQDASSALAVTLSDFSVTNTKQGAQLSWTTETEQDNDYFVVEHAMNSYDFKPIKTIDGAGSTQERQTYSFLHATPTNGTNYYRLRMVEFNGTTTYSEVVTIKKKAISKVIAYPQPATQSAMVHLEATEQEVVMMQVTDIMGRVIYYQEASLNQGENLIQLPCNSWTANHYTLTVTGKQFGKESIRFIKK